MDVPPSTRLAPRPPARPRDRARVALLAAAACAGLSALLAACGSRPGQTPAALTTTAAVRALRPGDAGGHPVRLSGRVTYFDGDWRILALQDATGSILVDPTLNFSVIQFKLEGPNGQDAGTTFDILVTFVGGGTQTFLNQLLPSNSKFDIFAGLGETLSSVAFWNLRTDAGASVNFTALKQVSFDKAPNVPEPSSWAMMLVGFGLIGAAARRRSAVRARIA